MSEQGQTDIRQGDFAISAKNVTKVFTNWQRENSPKDVLKNLFKPSKKIITALQNVSFTIEKGEFVAYAGPNGAGKSTTMKILCGMLKQNSGEVSVLNMSPEKQRIELMKKLGVLFGNRTELWWDHPVLQSFEWKKVIWDIPDEVYNKNLNMAKELFGIEPLLKTYARELSLGQKMKADIALMLLHSPEIILLDEPTLGLDVVAKRQLINALKSLNKEKNVTIMVTSHDMDDLEEMAQRILMISGGKLAFDGSFADLRLTTGNLSRISITMNNDSIPVIEGGSLLSAENGVFNFEFDLNKTPIQNLLYHISQINYVKDLEIKKAPIEQVITELYEVWSNV